LTAYRKLPVTYPMVPWPTSYYLPFSHNTPWLAYNTVSKNHPQHYWL